MAFTSTQAPSRADMSAQNDEQQQPGMYLSLSNDTKLEAKLHVFNMSSFIGLDFREPGFSFEFGGGHTPLPLSCYTTLLEVPETRGKKVRKSQCGLRERTIVSGMEASASCCTSAGFGLQDVHVKPNGCFCSLSVQLDCHPRLHVCISCRSQRKHARHIASVRDMLHIESSRRFWRVCVKACRAHMRIKGSRLGRSCARKIGPSFSTCMPIFGL